MNMMMAGMAPVMIALMMGRDMRAMWPAEPLFWFVMSIGVTAGFALAYPANLWLVSRRLKHGLMTVRAGRSIGSVPGEHAHAVDPRVVSNHAAIAERGDRTLAPRIENGVKLFDCESSVIQWYILPGKSVTAYAINRQVPGPRLDLQEGDHVRIRYTNHLPEPSTLHWHGLVVPNAMDGPANITQRPVAPGETFTYDFVVKQAGTYFYHYFTINGKAYPATDTLRMRVGQSIKFRFIG